MKNQESYKEKLENEIQMHVTNGWIGDLDPFTEFVTVALTKHLYEVMNSKFKPTFDEWEDLLINKDNLIGILDRLRQCQENEELRIMKVFNNA